MKFNLNVFRAILLYEWHSKFGNLETIKFRRILQLFTRSSWPVRFNSSNIHRPVSTQDFEVITKLNSFC